MFIKTLQKFYPIIILCIFFSCTDNTDIIEDNQSAPALSSIVDLDYPLGTGTSGDATTGLVGYGYDASGLCDSTSARSKIVDLTSDRILISSSGSFSPTLLSVGDFSDFSKKMNADPGFSGQNNTALLSHTKALMQLAHENVIDNNEKTFIYYNATVLNTRIKANAYVDEMISMLTDEFKNDITQLSAKDLVKKYGTHVLKMIGLGAKLEVVYTCKTNETAQDHDIYQHFLKRMEQFSGDSPGLVSIGEESNQIFTEEQMIFNTIGTKNKIFSLVNATDNNEDEIYIDHHSAFEDNIDNQFITIDEDGMVSIDELINDPDKKQEVKTYIEQYMSHGSL